MMKKLFVTACAVLLAGSAFAADLAPTKAPRSSLLGNGYPLQKCGMYYGVGTGGSATSVDGATPGTQVVQGEIDALVGYSCPIGAQGFWFVEGSFGVDNLNGQVNGFSIAHAPLVMIQRAGAGSPINTLFNPFGNSLSLPSLPILPSGVTAGPANGYFFAGVVEQDVSVQVGLQQNKAWLVAPMVGLGMLTRLSDGVVVDTWAGYEFNANTICPGSVKTCAQMGNAVRVGVAFKY
jgi:opacity protein-like surface antigen